MKHYSKKYLYYKISLSLISSFFTTIFIFAQAFLNEDDDFKIQVGEDNLIFYFLGLFIVVETILIIFYILQHKYTTYELQDDLIKLKKGIIFKQEKILKYEKMHAIDTKQNIIQKLFKITCLSIDSGSTTRANIAEIVIYEDDDKIDSIKHDIQLKMKSSLSSSTTLEINEAATNVETTTVFSSKVESTEEELVEEKDNILYIYSLKDKIYFVLMTSLTALAVGVLYFIFGSLILNLFVNDRELIDTMFFGFILLFGASLLITPVTTFLYVLFRYFGYKVVAKSDHLVISHGLLTKINHVLNYRKIKAIQVEEGLVKRIFKYAAIKLELVGFESGIDDNTGRSFNYLIPMCKRSEIKYLIERLNLDFRYVERDYKSPKVAFRYFISLPMIIFSSIYLTFLPFMLLIPEEYFSFIGLYIAIYASVMLLILIDGVFRYKNSGIYFDEEKTIIYYGSLNKKSIIILNKNITELELIDTYCRSKKEIASFKIHYFNNALKNVVIAHLLNKSIIDDLETKLRY